MPETEAELGISRSRTTVAYNGSVIENYPGYRAHLQEYIDGLVAGCRRQPDRQGGGGGEHEGWSIAFVEARESSLLGAAVALACLD